MSKSHVNKRTKLSSWLRIKRMQHSLTVKQLAEKTGISKSMIHSVEMGSRNFSDEKLMLLSKFFNISIKRLREMQLDEIDKETHLRLLQKNYPV